MDDDALLLDRLLGWCRGQPQPPFRMELNPTERCNLACIFCKGRTLHFRNRVEVPDERFLEIVDEAAALQTRQWRIVGGGEPMARPVTIRIMERIKTHGMTGYMITNGTLFTETAIEQLVSAGWDNLTVSLDGATPEIHDYLRGVEGAYERCLKVLTSFHQVKRRENVTKPFISFHYVLCNRNYEHLQGMLSLAQQLGVGYLFVQPLNVYHDEGAKLVLNEAQQQHFQALLPDLIKQAAKLKIGTNLPDLQTSQMISRSDHMDEVILEDIAKPKQQPPHPLCLAPCYEPWVGMVIRSDGNVGPCCVFEDRGDNILQKSVKDIWYGEYFTRLRRQILSGHLPPYCAQCGLAMVMANKELRAKLHAALIELQAPIQRGSGLWPRLKRSLSGLSSARHRP